MCTSAVRETTLHSIGSYQVQILTIWNNYPQNPRQMSTDNNQQSQNPVVSSRSGITAAIVGTHAAWDASSVAIASVAVALSNVLGSSTLPLPVLVLVLV